MIRKVFLVFLFLLANFCTYKLTLRFDKSQQIAITGLNAVCNLCYQKGLERSLALGDHNDATDQDESDEVTQNVGRFGGQS